MTHRGDAPDSGQATQVQTKANATVEPASPSFHIVGVGASAGGLEALEALFDHISADSGMAFVIIQHLSPDFKSMMDELLARHTKMKIRRVEDGMRVEPDSVYLIPPKQEMIIQEGQLLLSDKDPSHGLSLPIDTFLRSLAQDAGERAIGVILSGSGSDGSRGIRAIHEAGGLVIAQSADSARFDGMPKASVETGVVDLILAPDKMPEALMRYVAGAEVLADGGIQQNGASDGGGAMNAIFQLLRSECGIDFSWYKTTTVRRRIERWRQSSATRARTCRPRSKNWMQATKNCRRPTKNWLLRTKNCNPRTKNCTRSTKSSIRSTPSTRRRSTS